MHGHLNVKFDCSVVNSGYDKPDTCIWTLWYIISVFSYLNEIWGLEYRVAHTHSMFINWLTCKQTTLSSFKAMVSLRQVNVTQTFRIGT